MAGWLNRLASAVAPPDEPPADAPAGGPPEHWLALVRQRAPQFLDELDLPAPPAPPAPRTGRNGPVAGLLGRLVRSGTRAVRRALAPGRDPADPEPAPDGPAGYRAGMPPSSDGPALPPGPDWPPEPAEPATRPTPADPEQAWPAARVRRALSLLRWPVEVVRRLVDPDQPTGVEPGDRPRRHVAWPRESAPARPSGTDAPAGDASGVGGTAGWPTGDAARTGAARALDEPHGSHTGRRGSGSGRSGPGEHTDHQGRRGGSARSGADRHRDHPDGDDRRVAGRGEPWGPAPARNGRHPAPDPWSWGEDVVPAPAAGRPVAGPAVGGQAAHPSRRGHHGVNGGRAGETDGPAGSLPWIDGVGGPGVAVVWDDVTADRWPALPDDAELWVAPAPAFSPDHVHRLEREQRGC